MTLQIKKVNKKTNKESSVEQYLCKKVKELGGIPYKFTAPGRRSVPDRLCVMAMGIIIFVECKAPGKQPRPDQRVEISRIHARMHWVTVVDCRQAVDALIAEYKLKLQYQKDFLNQLNGGAE